MWVPKAKLNTAMTNLCGQFCLCVQWVLYHWFTFVTKYCNRTPNPQSVYLAQVCLGTFKQWINKVQFYPYFYIALLNYNYTNIYNYLYLIVTFWVHPGLQWCSPCGLPWHLLTLHTCTPSMYQPAANYMLPYTWVVWYHTMTLVRY